VVPIRHDSVSALTPELMRSPRFLAGLILLIVAMLPALLRWSEPAVAAWLRWPVAMVAAIVLGGLGAAIMAWRHQPLWIAALCGGLAAFGGNTALYFYTAWRSSLWNLEVGICAVVGALPALVLFRLLAPTAFEFRRKR
jgi:peptidoglycan/LPS O-acetylase OafA/YrhL